MSAADTDRGLFANFSTGAKMLALIAFALLPLGILATYSAYTLISNAHNSEAARERVAVEVSAGRLDAAMTRGRADLLSAIAATSLGETNEERCTALLRAIAPFERDAIQLALIDQSDEILCHSPEFSGEVTAGVGDDVRLNANTGAITLHVGAAEDEISGIAELSPSMVRRLTELPGPTANVRVTLHADGQAVSLHGANRFPDDPALIPIEVPLTNGRINYVATFGTTPRSTAEILTIALPILMWTIAALLGWYAVNRMIIKPLARLQEAVAMHGEGNDEFQRPYTRSPALEIRDLGRAFEDVFQTQRQHEADLAEGLAEQRRLTREVHHRVKNNLQVVASLLNIHARSAKTEDTAEAYASIQRRVDALAIVQRNLFAELDGEEGLAIRPVIAELASGLHQGAARNTKLSITLDIADVRVSQDIAVPVAFLITELVELAMVCSPDPEIAITLERAPDDGALLAVHSDALSQSHNYKDYDRYGRVLTGIARQLRNPLSESDDFARYEIVIPTLLEEK